MQVAAMLDDHLEEIDLRAFENSLAQKKKKSTSYSTGKIVGIDAENEDVITVVSHSHAPSQDSEWYSCISPRQGDDD